LISISNGAELLAEQITQFKSDGPNLPIAAPYHHTRELENHNRCRGHQLHIAPKSQPASLRSLTNIWFKKVFHQASPLSAPTISLKSINNMLSNVISPSSSNNTQHQSTKVLSPGIYTLLQLPKIPTSIRITSFPSLTLWPKVVQCPSQDPGFLLSLSVHSWQPDLGSLTSLFRFSNQTTTSPYTGSHSATLCYIYKWSD